MPSRCRTSRTRGTRRIFANCWRVRGGASGSDRAAAMALSSVMASSRAQSVLSAGSLLRGWRTTFEVRLLLMSGCLASADDAADFFVLHDGYNKQDPPAIHAQALNSLLAVVEPVVDEFESVRIFECPGCGREADTMLHKIRCGFGPIPFIVHGRGRYRIPVVGVNGMDSRGCADLFG